jgi:DNA repair protein RAD5
MGGILADGSLSPIPISPLFEMAQVQLSAFSEMGLGKTIMLAALILTNRPSDHEGALESSDDDTDQDSAERSDASFVPSPVKRLKKMTSQHAKQRQARLNLGGSKRDKPEDWEVQEYISDGDVKFSLKTSLIGRAQKSRATLVVAPVTLLGQWQEELWKASGKKLRVVFYYGASRDNVSLEEELEDGVDVVLTRHVYFRLHLERSATDPLTPVMGPWQASSQR